MPKKPEQMSLRHPGYVAKLVSFRTKAVRIINRSFSTLS